MKKLFLLAALCVAAAFSSCSKHDNEINHVEPPVPPETTPLAIAFAEGNSLEFNVGETKTVHYTITGGSDKTVVKAELQIPDDAYTVETTPTSTSEGTIAITAQTPETENSVVVTVSDGSQTVTAEIAVSTNAISEEDKLAITFAEGNSLEFNVGETKTVHYTITGGSENTVVTAEMQTPDDAYTVETTPTSAMEGTIAITAKTPETENCVIVTVSDGSQTIMTAIAVSTKPAPEELAITFAEGNSLEFNVGETQTVHYTITGGSASNVVKAEMQNLDDAYTLKTTPASTTEGTIAITAKTPETENCVIVTVSDGSQTIMTAIAVSTKPAPEELAITFAEGNSLEFNVGETKTVHYTITGGSDKTVVKAELQTPDDAYTVETTPTSATEGTIAITAKTPETDNCVLVTVSDGSQTVTAEIAVTVTLKASFDGKTVVVVTPGTLVQLLSGYDTAKITELTVIGNLNSMDISTLNNLPNLAVLDMENANLEVLTNQVFWGKTSLRSVKLPKTLKTITNYAFSGCNRLTSVTIPDSVTLIGDGTFMNCSSLTSVTIGNSVTWIGVGAFKECSSLTSITIPDGVTTIRDNTFSYCIRLSAFYGKFASSDNRCLIINGTLNSFAPAGLTSYTIPDSVTSIGEYAFYGCWNLTSVTIPDGVTTIGGNPFVSCRSLSAFYGKFASPDNRCLINKGRLIAFAPAGLTSYTISDSVTSIGNKAFEYCSSLTSVTIGNSVTTIGEQAFYYCGSLTSVTIGNSVTEIGNNVFYGCSNLKSIYCKAQTPPSVGDSAFYGVYATLYVPTGCKAAYAAADGWNKFTIIEMEF